MHNRSPSSSISSGATPYELWHKSKPDVAHFRVFGCTAYVHVKKDKRKQLQSHSEKCVFIGYPTNYKAWLFWNPLTKKEIVSNSAEFDERYFPGNSTKPIDWPVSPGEPSHFSDPVDQVGVQEFESIAPLAPQIVSEPESDSEEDSDDSDVKSESEPAQTRPQTPETAPARPQPPQTPQQQQNVPEPFTPAPPARFKRQEMSPASDIHSPEHKRLHISSAPLSPVQQSVPLPRTASQRVPEHRSGPTERFGHMHSFTGMMRRAQQSGSRSEPSVQAEAVPEEDDEMEERGTSPDPLDFLSQDALIASAVEHLADFDSEYLSYEDALEFALLCSQKANLASEPTHWKDIRGRPDAGEWYAAAQDEFQALMDNGTFEPVELPSGRKAIGCRWVFKLKRKADGAVDKYKARLVAKGFSQRPGLDFGQVFAPTARWAALRAIFALVALEDLDMYSVDVSNAFLNGELVKLAIEGISANFALKHTVSPADLCECKG